MVVTMCVPGISLSLVLSLHNTRASLYLHTITITITIAICVVSRSARCRMKLSRLLLSTLHQCQQSTLWLGFILTLDCCLVQCTVQANISSVCCVTRILILDSTSIASKRILNIQHLACDGRTVAVLGTSNIDISIYTIYVITFSHINILVIVCIFPTPHSLFYSVPALHLGRHSVPAI